MFPSIGLNRALLFLPAAILLVGGACGDDGTQNGGRTGGTGGGGGPTAGAGGSAGPSAGSGGTGRGGMSGGPGTGGVAGNAGSGVGGSGGTSLDGGAGSAGTGLGGRAGSGPAGAGGGGGRGGSSGVDGGAGTGGTAGKGGTSGTTGSGGSAASGGTAGTAGNGGSGGAGGSGGSSGASGSGGADGGATCNNPVFVTSDTNGGWSNGGYYVHNNMWNSAAGLGPETLSACAYNNWYVVSNQTNSAGAVKTYPNVHKDYNNVAISSLNVITSAFAETSPHVGIYNVAYDIWMNGVATSGSTELMIWTENYNQQPAGSKIMTITFGGRTYDAWKTSDNHYIAFVANPVFTSGSVDLREIIQWMMSQGWLPSTSTLGQICFGVEIVSTNGGNATFSFTDFSITTN